MRIHCTTVAHSALLATCVLATIPLSGQNVDLSVVGTTHPGFRIDGIDFLDESGWSVSGAGDVNGDGLADLIVGAHRASPGGDAYAGESYVVFGKATNMAVDLNALGGGGFRIDGIDPSDHSGRSVSGAGDVNGDGLADLIVSAYMADPGLDESAGESYVIFGKASGATVDLGALGAGGFRIDGIDAYDNSGRSVSGAGDVNGDGLADLIVGASGADPSGDSLAGEAYVVFGKTSNSTVDLGALGLGGFRIDGIDTGDGLGRSVSGAGDVNGDGLADIVVGAPFASPGGDFSAGESYVVFGKTTNSTVDLGALGAGGFRIDGVLPSNRAGWSVSGAGDVNGDGLADVIVGANLADPGLRPAAGVSYVVFGKSTSAPVDLAALGTSGFRIEGISANDESGYSVSDAGDVNGDGLADVIVGAWRADADRDFVRHYGVGESYVVFGKTSSSTVALNALGAGGFRIDGIDAHDNSGVSVSGAGDVNGDGSPDLIVGAPGGDPGGDSLAGESYVVFNTSTTPASATYKGTAPAGDAPRTPVGAGSVEADGSTSASRCWIDFDSGAAPSMQTVVLTRSDGGLTGIDTSRTANVVWQVTTNRTAWSNAVVTFKYTDAEIAGLTEGSLVLYKAPAASGPWTPLATTQDTALNTASATVSSFSYFALFNTSSSIKNWTVY